MYAASVYPSIDPEQASAAAVFISDTLPRIPSDSGFVSGYWVDPVEGQGLGFPLFDTKEQAVAAAPQADWSAPGVVMLRTDLRRIAISLVPSSSDRMD